MWQQQSRNSRKKNYHFGGTPPRTLSTPFRHVDQACGNSWVCALLVLLKWPLIPCYSHIHSEYDFWHGVAGKSVLNVLDSVLPKWYFFVLELWLCRPYTWFQTGHFLPRDAMLARCVLSWCVCLSARLSVCHMCGSTKMAKSRIIQSTPYDSAGTLVFWWQNFGEIPVGSPPMGAPN